MYKTLATAVVLLAVLALAGGQSKVAPLTVTSPIIVARVSKTNQTAAIPVTTMFTPPRDGLFRISAYAVMTTLSTGGENGDVIPYLDYTDESGQQQLQLNGLPSAGAGFVDLYSEPFRATAGNPVSYSVSATDVNGVYELFLTVERLD
jgi:hypothetical protein